MDYPQNNDTPAPEDVQEIITPLPYSFQLPVIGSLRKNKMHEIRNITPSLQLPSQTNNFIMPPSVVIQRQ